MKRKRSELSVLGILGRGTYGTVYKVTLDGDLYALKVLTHEDSYDLADYFKTTFRELFFGNYSAVASGRTSLGGLLPLAFCSFGTCSVSENALRGLRDVCLQLQKLHQDGIIHRDIKLDNILLYETHQELADFSLSTRIDMGTEWNVYTIWYRPPECLLHMNHTSKADVWALGITFVSMLLKRPVYKDMTEAGALKAVVGLVGTQDFEPLVDRFGRVESSLKSVLAGFSESVIDLVSCMLRVNPGLRLSMAQVLEHPFWSGPIDAIIFRDKEYVCSHDLDFEIHDIPVFFKRVPTLIRVRIFDLLVKACDAFQVSKRVLLSAFYFWDTLKESGAPWYAACFYAASCLETEQPKDFERYMKYFNVSEDSFVTALWKLPTLTKALPSSFFEFDDTRIYSVVSSPHAWLSDTDRSGPALHLTTSRASFLLL